MDVGSAVTHRSDAVPEFNGQRPIKLPEPSRGNQLRTPPTPKPQELYMIFVDMGISKITQLGQKSKKLETL